MARELIRVEFSESVATASAGYQEFGLTGKTGATETGLADTTQYYFKVNVDGGGVTEYDITTAGDTTFTGVIALMDTAVTATGATFSIVGGDLRCTSGTVGDESAIAITAGTTGTELLATLTDFTAVETAVAGEDTTSTIVEFSDDVTSGIVSINFVTSSTAKIQTTTNTRTEIDADTAIWFDWDFGSISANRQESFDAPNAMRLINEGAGSITWSIRANR
jgi:hypothetical protein